MINLEYTDKNLMGEINTKNIMVSDTLSCLIRGQNYIATVIPYHNNTLLHNSPCFLKIIKIAGFDILTYKL